MSLSDYLVGKHLNPGAHQKYRPYDMSPSDARNVIKVCIPLFYNLNLLYFFYSNLF